MPQRPRLQPQDVREGFITNAFQVVINHFCSLLVLSTPAVGIHATIDIGGKRDKQTSGAKEHEHHILSGKTNG
jgi:hypothetical protein